MIPHNEYKSLAFRETQNPAFVGMKSPSQHLNPTSVEICVDEMESVLSVFDVYEGAKKKESVRTVDELHMTATGEPVNVTAKTSFATMFVANPDKKDDGGRRLVRERNVTYRCRDTSRG